MNRRGFISMLAGAAGAPLVPWRGLDEPSIFLPPAGGWAARSLGEMWLEYCEDVRPLGVLLQTKLTDEVGADGWELHDMFRSPLPPGVIELRVSPNLPRSTERLMRQSLLNRPAYSLPCVMSDLLPWKPNHYVTGTAF